MEKMSDLDELGRIGRQYANGGNYTTALLAWMRAEELGCTKYRKNIVALLFKMTFKVMSDKRQKLWLNNG